jgi:hypothetical protein
VQIGEDEQLHGSTTRGLVIDLSRSATDQGVR